MIITKEILEKINTDDMCMQNQTFVFNYTGKHRSDLKESQKAKASAEVMERYDCLFRST